MASGKQAGASNIRVQAGLGVAAVLAVGAAWAATEAGSLTFLGANAGAVNTGDSNTFIGVEAGKINTTGSGNTFVGALAGRDGSTTSSSNTFVGASAGRYTNETGNTFVGSAAGQSNVTGFGNTFVGTEAGANSAGDVNSFFGRRAGYLNSSGGYNAFFGSTAGAENSSGSYNAFFGSSAGLKNNTGTENAYFGASAGFVATTSSGNSFFGGYAGQATTTGSENTFVGRNAGITNTVENYNTLLGARANTGPTISNATAIGYRAQVSQGDSLVLGSIPDVNQVGAPVPGSYVSVGIGTDRPGFPLHIKRADTTENLLRLEQSSDTLKDRALMLLSNKGGTRFEFQNTATGNAWRFQAGTGAQNNFEITDVDVGVGVIEMRLTPVGNLVIAGTLTQNSNVHDKTGIVPVDGADLLERLDKLPISQWRYKNDAQTPHVGPMAQDFYSAFRLGDDETKIAPGDMAGVALAAIKSQRATIRSLTAEVASLKDENAGKEARLARLEARLAQLEVGQGQPAAVTARSEY